MILTYESYVAHGGTVDSSTFSALAPLMEVKLNYYTFGRIPSMETIPDTIYTLLTKMIDTYASYESAENKTANINSYSNGIESISYVNASEQKAYIEDSLQKLIFEYLYAYPELLSRRRYKQ